METDLQTIHKASSRSSFPIYIMSGGVGASGEQLVRTVLAQFENADVEIILHPKIFNKNQVRQILQSAVETGAVVAHTFVNPKLRKMVSTTAADLGVIAVDLVGPLMESLADQLEQKPIGKPGLYRQLYQSYFARIEAMDYTLAHDDGKNPQGWDQAEIILLGASRVGKTPLSLYLSVMGWKIANVPLVSGVMPHPALFSLKGPQLVGLTIAPSELIEHREYRQRRLGVVAQKTDYTNPEKVFEEIESIEKLLKRQRVPTVDVTGKPIETSADEIIRLVRRKQKTS